MSRTELCYLSACEQKIELDQGSISAVALIEAHLEQIERFNPVINAIVTLDPEGALQQASVIDQRRKAGQPLGPLAGLPVAHKDLTLTKGMRTTFGSKLYKDFIPDQDSAVVKRLRAAGAITMGKTNTPEWGAGSQTFNDVFGATTNPFDPTKTCGGSSGGAAAALAARLVPLCDGSDLGGSLRNPASFCNVVGFRTSPGRVSNLPNEALWNDLSITGPMARTVDDCALLLSAMAGPDPASPLSIHQSGAQFWPLDELAHEGVRVAFSPDFNGQIPFEPDVVKATETAGALLEAVGCSVERTCLDFSGADRTFEVLRALSFYSRHGPGIEHQPDMYKDTVKWNAAEGAGLTKADLMDATAKRNALGQRCAAFFADFDFLVLPVVQVLPFDVNEPWVKTIQDEPMTTYISWMKSCYMVSALGTPAISIPLTFSDQGLPVGLQIVAPWGQDLRLLQFSKLLEAQISARMIVPRLVSP